MTTKPDRRSWEESPADKERADNSLQGKALARASGQAPPKTLTPYEWEEWYAEHGVPDSHRPAAKEESKGSWWRRWLRR